MIRGKTANGKGLGVVRFRGDQVEVGAVQPLEQGKPIHGEVVKLHPRPEQPAVCDVEVQLDARRPETTVAPAAATGKGPPRVASEQYRRNWDAIWSPDKKTPLEN